MADDYFIPVRLLKLIRTPLSSTIMSMPPLLPLLAEHHFIILVNHFAAKVTTVDFRFLCISHIRHQAKQHCCKKNVRFHDNINLLQI